MLRNIPPHERRAPNLPLTNCHTLRFIKTTYMPKWKHEHITVQGIIPLASIKEKIIFKI